MYMVRYKEHIEDTKAKKRNSKYALHILDRGQTCGSIDQTSELLHFEKRRR
jgi:hypothetical protein